MEITIISSFDIGDEVIITYDGFQLGGVVSAIKVTKDEIMYEVVSEKGTECYSKHSLHLNKSTTSKRLVSDK